jgi:hypothetical protein
MILYPFIGLASILATLPMFLYLSFASDFKRIHPLRPKDYAFLCRRLLFAAQQNNLKVTSKEL